MPESPPSLDIESLADRARSLWREAVDRQTTGRVELFVKVSRRCKATRDVEGKGAMFDRAHESGLAVRVVQVGQDHAGFAAASGLAVDAVRWAADAACAFRAAGSRSAPSPPDSVEDQRWDLDAPIALPTEEELTTGLEARPKLEWVEAGTTIEVLIGAEGWLAARRRHRFWALNGGPEGGLLAQRGFADWEKLLDQSHRGDGFAPGADSEDLEGLVLTPEAASSVVAALVDEFHGPGAARPTQLGHGWDVIDDPIRPDGLAGGSFDDVGFPAVARVLAADGAWRDGLGGPGTFRRASFREPPKESVSNIVMPSGDACSVRDRANVARRCRVVRLTHALWVLELDLADSSISTHPDRRWVQVQPEALLAACKRRLGGSRVTAAGPIVPGLWLEGLRSSRTSA